MMQVSKILLVEDHPLVRAGCKRVLQAIRSQVLEAKTGSEALHFNRVERPEIVFLDISLPDANGTDLLERLRTDNPRVRVIMLTMYEDAALARRLFKRGAAGYLTKSDSPEFMLHAIEQVLQGHSFVSPHVAARTEAGDAAHAGVAELSPRDRRIVELLGEGRSLSEISFELGQSYKTIANVTNMIRNKLGLQTSVALIKFAVERRLAGLAGVSTEGPRDRPEDGC